jgi:hypothetical protein
MDHNTRQIISVHIFIYYNFKIPFNVILHIDQVAPNDKLPGLYLGDADSNLGHDNDYRKWVFPSFSSVNPGKCQDSASN